MRGGMQTRKKTHKQELERLEQERQQQLEQERLEQELQLLLELALQQEAAEQQQQEAFGEEFLRGVERHRKCTEIMERGEENPAGPVPGDDNLFRLALMNDDMSLPDLRVYRDEIQKAEAFQNCNWDCTRPESPAGEVVLADGQKVCLSDLPTMEEMEAVPAPTAASSGMAEDEEMTEVTAPAAASSGMADYEEMTGMTGVTSTSPTKFFGWLGPGGSSGSDMSI